MEIAVYRDSAAGRLPIARIEAAEDGSNASLSYDPEYLHSHQSINDLGISERLPLREEAYASEEISPFLQGLLPEGETLGNLAQMYQVARSNWPMLLQRLGCESVGGADVCARRRRRERLRARVSPIDGARHCRHAPRPRSRGDRGRKLDSTFAVRRAIEGCLDSARKY